MREGQVEAPVREGQRVGRADLEAVLRSGSINQYGDPLALERLKLAARRHLAGGCQKRSGSTATVGGTTTSTPTTQQGRSKRHARSKQHKQPKQHPKSRPRLAAGAKAPAGGDNGSFIAGRGLIIGLLALALAFAGWLTKRALSARD